MAKKTQRVKNRSFDKDLFLSAQVLLVSNILSPYFPLFKAFTYSLWLVWSHFFLSDLASRFHIQHTSAICSAGTSFGSLFQHQAILCARRSPGRLLCTLFLVKEGLSSRNELGSSKEPRRRGSKGRQTVSRTTGRPWVEEEWAIKLILESFPSTELTGWLQLSQRRSSRPSRQFSISSSDTRPCGTFLPSVQKLLHLKLTRTVNHTLKEPAWRCLISTKPAKYFNFQSSSKFAAWPTYIS